MKKSDKEGYQPIAVIVCFRCGSIGYGKSGTKICDCPDDPASAFTITKIETVDDYNPPDDAA